MPPRTLEVGPIQDGIDWPLGRSEVEVLRDVICNTFRPARTRYGGTCLWGEIRHMIGYGSTSSVRLCVYLGLDPDCRVVRRR